MILKADLQAKADPLALPGRQSTFENYGDY